MEIISCKDLTEKQINEICNLLSHYRILYIKHKDYIEICPENDIKKLNFHLKKLRRVLNENF